MKKLLIKVFIIALLTPAVIYVGIWNALWPDAELGRRVFHQLFGIGYLMALLLTGATWFMETAASYTIETSYEDED